MPSQPGDPRHPPPVIPATAGIHANVDAGCVGCWIPAFAGMTKKREGYTGHPRPNPDFVIPAKAGIHQDGCVREEFSPTVYLLASGYNGTLDVGVTSNLMARIHQHRAGTLPGFTRDYGAKRLVWFEPHATMEAAILREKRIKKWNRVWKIRLIVEANPEWRDLAEDLGFEPLT